MSNPREKRLEASVEIGTLFAFYGGLLTQKQREALSLHYDEDLSLGEIAEQFGVSRQSVHELITRSAEKLRGYEAALGIARRTSKAWGGLEEAVALLDGAAAQALPQETKETISRAAALIQAALHMQEDDGHGI